MKFFSQVLSGLIFSMACNLDTVLLAMGYSVKGIRVPAMGSIIIAAITTAITWGSLALGAVGAELLDAGFSQLVGGLVLVGIGAWFLLDCLRRLGKADESGGSAPPSLWAWVTLAAALAANNAGIGVAAGVSGLSPVLASGCNFAVTLLFLRLGRALGAGVPGRFLGKYALPISGILLIVLGLWEAFF